MKKKREDLIAKGLLHTEKNHLLFAKDIEFGSPSTAAAIVRGVDLDPGAIKNLVTPFLASSSTMSSAHK